MLLPGRLSASTLGDLLGALHREQVTGQLDLVEIRGPRGRSVPGRRHRIELRQGLVSGVHTALPVPPLGEILKREGLVGSTVLAWLLRRLGAGDDRAAGEILIRDGFARPDVIRAGLKKQLAERIEALFTLEDAAVTFHTARPVHARVTRADPLPPSDFLHGRPRLRDRLPPSSRPAPSSRGAAGSYRSPAEPEPPRSATPPAPISRDPRMEARRLLGLDEAAGPDEARRAFRKIAFSMHPDRIDAATPEERALRAERLARLTAAYHLLVP